MIYLPEVFHETERETAFDIIERFAFATLISGSDGGPTISHVPLLVDRSGGRERLVGHVARANRHAALFDGQHDAVAVFSGPHGYVSPAWYAEHPSVPTWNYAVVHVHGRPAAVSAPATWEIVKALVERFEGEGSRWTDLPSAFVEDNLRAIVGFEMPVDRVDAKLKLSQNRTVEDRQGVIAGLEKQGAESRGLAAFMKDYLGRKGGLAPR